jgi:hypothetical protein
MDELHSFRQRADPASGEAEKRVIGIGCKVKQ